MGFVEEQLPVRYLGIPLIGTRMLVRDCNKLVEQVKARVQNWKHRALSFAGRLQLINSVLQSLQVYWCSVLLLPKTTIKDIGKIFKGFLWSGGDLRKGSAKFAWKTMCRPKEEGGLGIRSLQTWNEALLSRQIWRLFTTKDSLWTWGWDGRFPSLQLQPLPLLQTNKDDGIYWQDLNGNQAEFTPTQVWKDIRLVSPGVSWYKVVWFKHNIPSHAFILWLATHDRLMTHERMLIWHNSTIMQCMLCKMVPDSTPHLLFECQYPREVWTIVCTMCNFQTSDINLHHIIANQIPRLQSNHIQIDIERLALAATVYFIWRERNSRHHNGSTIPHAKLAMEVIKTLEARLCGIPLKWSAPMEDLCKRWKIPRPSNWPPPDNINLDT
ncbi:hypothetical protein LXL04_035505 [Taraxacum kok-saghyz]